MGGLMRREHMNKLSGAKIGKNTREHFCKFKHLIYLEFKPEADCFYLIPTEPTPYTDLPQHFYVNFTR